MRLVRLWDAPGTARPGWESHLPILWDRWEMEPVKYAYGLVADWLDRTPQPVHLAIIFYMNDLVDHTPKFHQRQFVLEAGGQQAVMPNYTDPDWQRAYWGAIEAMAVAFRDHPKVAAFWLATGLDQETTPIKAIDGVDWNVPAAKVLDPYDYLDFIVRSCQVAAEAWENVPVYLEGFPAPGGFAGKNLKGSMLSGAADAGVGLKVNGLIAEDTQDAVGLGRLAHTQRYDGWMQFERRAAEPARPGTHASAGDAYWMMMRCLAWDVDFLAVQESWEPHVRAALDWLPDARRWIVFRDAEFGDVWWDADHGVAGEPGLWGKGLAIGGADVDIEYRGGSFDFGRWYLRADDPVTMTTSLPDGDYDIHVWLAISGSMPEIELRKAAVQDGKFLLSSGRYHRLDLFENSRPVPYLPEYDPAQTLREHVIAVRWWMEEYTRQAEAGNNERAAEILYSLIKRNGGLLYRLEDLVKERN